MLIRTFLFGIVGLLALYFIGIPLFKLIKLYVYQLKDPVESAQARLERARKEAIAAELDKETNQVYENLYKDEEPLKEEPSNEEKGKTVEK